jgi:hypothetical protein
MTTVSRLWLFEAPMSHGRKSAGESIDLRRHADLSTKYGSRYVRFVRHEDGRAKLPHSKTLSSSPTQLVIRVFVSAIWLPNLSYPANPYELSGIMPGFIVMIRSRFHLSMSPLDSSVWRFASAGSMLLIGSRSSLRTNQQSAKT